MAVLSSAWRHSQSVTGLVLLACVGCGSDSGSGSATSADKTTDAPQPAAASVTSGTSSAAPGQPAVANRPPVKKGVVSSAELAAVIDLSQLPALPDSKFNSQTAAEMNVVVTNTVKTVAEFYLKAFADLGFEPATDPGSLLITDDFAQATLNRDGFFVSLSILKGGEPGKVMVAAFRHGALDARTLPVSERAKSLYANSTSSMYVARGSVAEEADFVREKLKAAGWQSFAAPHSASPDDPDRQEINVRNQGYRLSVSVSKAPAQDNQTVVQYLVHTIAYELPAPATAVNIEYDDTRRILMCDVPGDLPAVQDFYLEAMPKVGFRPLKHDELKPKRGILRFEPADKGILLIEMATEDHETTRVEFRLYTAEFLAEMDRKAEEARKAREAKTATPEADKIDARDIPLPAGALDVTYKAKDREIRFHSKDLLEPIAKSLINDLTAIGWKYDETLSVINENVGSLEFKKGPASVSATLINTGLGEGTKVTLTTRGLSFPAE